uniref:DHC_N2 domain-containing protein n=1 Tax=Ascaris lumbricoides TaxID=6252 RepID=A0A0M3HKH7_ASCLU
MNEIQRKWIYLEPIFGRGSLPSEASRFNRVDVEFRTILNEVARDSRLVSLCSRQYLRRTLEQIIDQLNRCQRALNQFLEVYYSLLSAASLKYSLIGFLLLK